MPTRRDILRGSLATGALLAASRLARGQGNPWAQAFAQYSSVRTAPFTTPLPIPPLAVPTRREGNTDVYELTVRRGTAQPLPGAPTAIVGLDGRWPGPTLRAARGRPLALRLHNAIEEKVTLHNHGHRSAPSSDGHPLDVVRPGGVKEFFYPNDQAGGTYWYHDHAMGLAGAHVYHGLAGFYLIDDPAEEALGLPGGAYDVPIVVQDRMFDAGNQLSYTVDSGTIFIGFLGNALCANGVLGPRFAVEGRRYRLRLLNGANARNLHLALADGSPMVQIAADGNLLAAPVPQSVIRLSPGERADCIIDFARYPAGSSVVLRNLDPTWPCLPDVLRFDVGARAANPSRIPDRLATIARLDGQKVDETRRIRFQLADGQWTLNGLRYDPERIDFRPRLGSLEIWEIENGEATQMHPFHQHGVPFQVLDIDGRPPPPELRGWKDTVAVGPSVKLRIAMRFVATPGIYVLHCHKLEHEDHAMMLQQEVVA